MERRPREGLLPFRIEQSDEPLIARGGLILPYEMAKALKLPRVIDAEVPRPGSGHGYQPSRFVMPLILMLHGGGRQLEDLREIRGEQSLRELLEMRELPACCTAGDWLRRMGLHEKGLPGLGKVDNHLNWEVLKRDSRTEYTLDTDATIIEAEKSDSSDKCCQSMMPPGKRISYYRSDSAAYQARVINHCFDCHMLFTITADQDAAVRQAIRTIKENEWQRHEKDREIAETVHTMNETKQAFRLIVQRWPKLQPDLFDPEPYCYHAIATNREEEAKEVVALHNQRGQVENFIKELKDGFGMNWMPCGETHANAVFFRIGVIAYNLFQAMKLLALPIWWRNTTIATARWKLYQVAARVVHHAHQIIMKLAVPIEKIVLFRQARYIYAQLGSG